MSSTKFKKSITLGVSLSVLTVTGGLLLAEKSEDKDATASKKIVFLTGDDIRHASGTHEFYAGALLLKDSLMNAGYEGKFQCEVVNNWPKDTSVFNDANVIVHYYPGNQFHFMNKNQGLIDTLAKKGVSQIFIHYAVDPGQEAEGAMKSWTGAVYKDKYSTNPHWELKAQLGKHPINNGVGAFTSLDEWYVKMDYASELQVDYETADNPGDVYSVMHGNNEDIQKSKKLKKEFKGKDLSSSDLTVFWATERTDGGRGVGITGAHFHKNWANEAFRKQVLNAIVWSARLPVPEDGVKSPEVTEEMINMNLDARKKGGLKTIKL